MKIITQWELNILLEKEAKKKDESDTKITNLGLGKSLPRINIITAAIIAPTGLCRS
jgi:hypothetical protein